MNKSKHIKGHLGPRVRHLFPSERSVSAPPQNNFCTSQNHTYGSYVDGPMYSTGVDNNPIYGEEVTIWEGALITDTNHEYESVV